MIYFDNAATTMNKPPEVVEAITQALSSFGGVGRGVHPASIAAGMAVYEAREAVAQLFNAPSSSRVAFALNATMALNIAISGLLPNGGCAVTTASSHNSVLRPLFRARDLRECSIGIAQVNAEGSLDFASFEALLDQGGVSLVVATHSSNLTGDVYDIKRMADSAHRVGALFVLDAAQTAGAIPLDMRHLGVDVLCFTGHKSLFGPQGTGGLCFAECIDIPPFIEGGSGTHSFEERQPRFYPEALEAGTINAHGLAGLCAGINYLQNYGIEEVFNDVASLTDRFEKGVASCPSIHILGGHGGISRTGIVALNIEDIDSAIVADSLSTDYGVCVRAGAHCAPLMHNALGTQTQGAVRFSFSHLTTEYEIDAGISALLSIAEKVASV